MTQKAEETSERVKFSGHTSKSMRGKPEVKLPHNFEGIIKDADSPVDRSSMDKLYDQLHAGIFIDNKKMKYWIDNKGKRNCFLLHAKYFAITWADNTCFWRWITLRENSDDIPVAQLASVSWLEIVGWFNTTKLTPGTQYEVVFIVLLKEAAYGWGVPVSVLLLLPDGTKQEHKESLVPKPREQWIEIHVGEFKTTPENTGEIQMRMYEYAGHWKSGLVIKGAFIRPKSGI